MSHVCPWWFAYTFDNAFRRILHKPEKIFGLYVKPGMTVLDVGCGMGVNSLGLARMVGSGGRVISIDLQKTILDVLEKRARRAKLLDRIEVHQCAPNDICIDEMVMFINAFWMVHEVPNQRTFFQQAKRCLDPGGALLVAEPIIHVSKEAFGRTIDTAKEAGFRVIDEQRIRLSHASVLSPTIS